MTTGAQATLDVRFGVAPAPGDGTEFCVPVPPLGERTSEQIFGAAETLAAGAARDVRLFAAGGVRVGALKVPVAEGRLAQQTQAAYAQLLAAMDGRRPFRVWNYVPRINETSGGLENYRAFCVGRARGFEAAFGERFAARLPAASAVGCEGDELVVVFAAGEGAPRHFENPAQLPAYEYPAEHGPRSPSFARATLAEDGARRFAFVSGTAAIRGHATVAAGDFAGQLACTLENLRLISLAAGLGEGLELSGGARRHFKVYLRRAEDYARTRARLERSLVRAEDEVVYLRADICRAALDVEIEATLVAG